MISPEAFNHYKTGIPALDDPHWAIFQTLNALQKQLKSGNFKEAEISKAAFFRQVEAHCQIEESLMEKYEYPHVEQHKNQHPESRKILLKYEAYQVEALDVSGMSQLLASHIDWADREFGVYMHSLIVKDGSLRDAILKP